MGAFQDLTGLRFGRWTVLQRVDSKQGRSYCLCKCDCGNTRIVAASSLKNGSSKSCGCFSADTSRKFFSKDLIGKKFGMLTVQSLSEPHITAGGQKQKQYLCKCDCGREAIVRACHLVSGHTVSCGCIQNRNEVSVTRQKVNRTGNRLIDLTGQRFGMWTVIRRDDDVLTLSGHKKAYWICQCDCGTIKSVSGRSLRDGRTTSCGCVSSKRIADSKKKDLSGQQFGRLHVLGFVGFEKKHALWLCKCSCGKEIKIDSSSLLSGKVRSCGCLSLETKALMNFEDLTGKRFGLLTVLSRAENHVREDGQTDVMWNCQCDCGNVKTIRAYTLKTAQMPSCGCLTISSGEMIVESVLTDLRLDYKKQIRFEGLNGVGSLPLSFDFGIYSGNKLELLIEYQGQQHFYAVSIFGGNKAFEKQQEHDKLKREYAKTVLNVPLLEIPYTIDSYDSIMKEISAAMNERNT